MPIKGGPTTKFRLDYVNGRLWDVAGIFGWQYRDGIIVNVPDMFRHDFNSSPRILWRVIPPTEFGEAGTQHDWMYRNCGELDVIFADGSTGRVKWTRAECDERYREILQDTEAPKWKENIMYTGVRVGGWKAWRGHAKRIKNAVIVAAITLGALLWAGCLGYRHERVDGEKRESTTVVSLFKKGEASVLGSHTSDTTNGYVRDVGIENAKSSGDAKSIGALGDSVAKNNPYTLWKSAPETTYRLIHPTNDFLSPAHIVTNTMEIRYP